MKKEHLLSPFVTASVRAVLSGSPLYSSMQFISKRLPSSHAIRSRHQTMNPICLISKKKEKFFSVDPLPFLVRKFEVYFDPLPHLFARHIVKPTLRVVCCLRKMVHHSLSFLCSPSRATPVRSRCCRRTTAWRATRTSTRSARWSPRRRAPTSSSRRQTPTCTRTCGRGGGSRSRTRATSSRRSSRPCTRPTPRASSSEISSSGSSSSPTSQGRHQR